MGFLKNKIFIGIVFVVVIIAAGGGSFYYGYQKGKDNPQTVIVRGVANLDDGKPESVDFGVFWDAWRAVKDNYVDVGKLKDQDLVYGAVSGLVKALGDDNSVFFPPSDAKKFEEDISGEISGIGAEIGIRKNQLIIIAPLKSTPAERAGLKNGDKILAINDEPTADLTLEEAVKLIRGEIGTKVILMISREEWDEPKNIEIVRDVIEIPTLEWGMKDGDIAYVQLYNFYDNAPFLFYKAALGIAFKNPKGIILDLRNNPGGYLNVGVNISSWFLDIGDEVVSEEFASGKKTVLKSTASGFFRETPVVVLVNEGSASASEIVAGALRDNRGVKLIGTKTFGKGTVQELQTLKDGSIIKVTVAYWRMPKGGLIEKNGLIPDYQVEINEKDVEDGLDPQLRKAIEVLREEIRKAEIAD